MRTLSTTFEAAAAHAEAERAVAIELQDLSYAVGDPAHAEVEHTQRCSPVSNAMRIVSLLALGQSVLFLLLWLVMCASAGAATPPKKDGFSPVLQTSSYAPTKSRDPFAAAAVPVEAAKAAPAALPLLHVEGILSDGSQPTAVINGQLLPLNKTVNLDLADGTIPVKAVEITESHVVLEVHGQRIEVKMDSN